jgi:hypothetical protein
MTADPSNLSPRVPRTVHQAVRDNRPYTRYMNDPNYHAAVNAVESWMDGFGFTEDDLRNIIELAIRKNLERKSRP